MGASRESELERELHETRARLADAEETLRAIRGGEIDAVVVDDSGGPHVYTLKSAAEPYRMLVEQMPEGALTVSADGVILYSNQALAGIIGMPLERVIGTSLLDWMDRAALDRLLGPPGSGGHEMALARPDGRAATVVASSAPLDTGEDRLIAVVVRDITRQQLRLRHEAVVQATSDAVYVLTPDLVIETWNPGAETLFGYAAHEIIGRSASGLSPDPTDRALERLVEMAGRTGQPASGDATIRSKRGQIRSVILSVAPLKDKDERITGYAAITHDITERKHAEERLRGSHDTYLNLIQNNPFGVYLVDSDFCLAEVSMGAKKVFSHVHPLVGRDFADVVRIIWAEPFASEVINRFHHTLATGEPYKAGDTTERRADIDEEETYDWKIERVTLPDGRFGVVCYFYDMTERKRQEERVRMLMHEVNHRSKNMLSLVQAVAKQTAAKSPADFMSRFDERIRAMADAQDLVVKNEWKNVRLEDLVGSQLAHFSGLVGSRIVIQGPPIAVTSAAAQTFGMVFHELATNAGKYGALSNEAGRVEISWGLRDSEIGERRFTIAWVERGGPRVLPPKRRGFGSTVVDAMAKASLEGVIELDYDPAGLTWRLDCPAGRIIEGADEPTRVLEAPQGEFAKASRRGRILVVEDEVLIAMEIADALNDAGFEVLGPAATSGQAQDLLARVSCDAAVLDVNLGTHTSEPLARILARDGVPFVMLTGYSRHQLSAVFDGAAVLSKPLRPELLIAELELCLQTRH